MVTISDYQPRVDSKGATFFVLILSSGIELVKSKKSGNTYFTERKCSKTCTFSETTCKALLGKDLPGSVERVTVEPYEYTTRDGEKIMLDFKWEYNPEEMKPE